MGLNAYLYSILTLLDLLRTIGAEQVYIARSPSEPEIEKVWLAGCWNARVALAGLVGLLMFLGGLGVSLIGDARLGFLLMVLSLMSPLLNMRSAELIHKQKKQDFGPLSRFEIAAAFIQSLLPLMIVYYCRSVEWLVIGNVIAAALCTALSHVVFPMQFKLRMLPELRNELVFYGRNNIAISVLVTLQTNLDNFAVGSFIARSVLGIYSTGYRLAMTPHSFIYMIAQRILVPMYRRAVDRDVIALLERWRPIFRLLTIGYTAVSASTIVLADWGIALLFGPAWATMGYVLVFATFIAFFRGLAVTIGPLLFILRVPHIETRFKIAEVFVFVIFVAIGAATRRIEPLLWGGIVSYLLAFVLRWAWWRRELAKLSPAISLARDTLYPLIGLSILLGAVGLRTCSVSPWISLAALGVTLAGMFLFCQADMARR
jgi:O-antigen/teichoic acid export membrane protein